MYPATIANALQWAAPVAAGWLAAACRTFSEAVAALAVTALWQGVAVASGVAICLRLAPRMSAAQRFAVWAAGFAAVVSLPFLPQFLLVAAGAASGNANGAAVAAARPWLLLDMRWSLAIAALWAAASAMRATDLVLHAVRLRRLWQTAVPVAPGKGVAASLVALAGQSGRGPVRICATQWLERPGAIGFFAPRILIPDWLLQRLSPAELEQIVLHEAEHLRRRDDWTNLFQKLCLVAFPLNPALWWMERRLCREREMACDDAVVKVTEEPRAYAACLASLAERSLQRRAEALSLGAWQHRSELARRVHRILRRQHALNPVAAHLLLGVLGLGVLWGTAEMAHSPQLVGFIPARSARLSATAVPSRTQPARLLRAANAPAPQDGVVRAGRGFDASRMRAVFPVSRLAVPVAAEASRQPTVLNAAVEPEEEAPALEAGSGQPRQVVLTAERAGRQPSSTHEAQWMVFTAWEQVETLTPDGQQETSRATAAERGGQGSRQASSRILVTRLILKVVPTGSRSTQPAAVPIRGGWFFIQL